MRGVFRMLMMFGPMLYRFYKKYQQKKANQQPMQNADNQNDIGQ